MLHCIAPLHIARLHGHCTGKLGNKDSTSKESTRQARISTLQRSERTLGSFQFQLRIIGLNSEPEFKWHPLPLFPSYEQHFDQDMSPFVRSSPFWMRLNIPRVRVQSASRGI